jgi:hypothetical protein
MTAAIIIFKHICYDKVVIQTFPSIMQSAGMMSIPSKASEIGSMDLRSSWMPMIIQKIDIFKKKHQMLP